MYTATHDPLIAHAGEPIQITYNVTDNAGNPVNVNSATGSFKIGREMGSKTLLTKTSSPALVFSGTQVIVKFNTNEVQESAVQAIGDFFTQLRIVIAGDDLVTSKGRLKINAVLA